MGKHERLTGAERVARRRARLRAQGLRPKQFWVPDLRDPKVRAEIDHAVAAINASDERDGMMDWIESLAARFTFPGRATDPVESKARMRHSTGGRSTGA